MIEITHQYNQCPYCHTRKIRVTGTKKNHNIVYRYYYCRVCGHSFRSKDNPVK